MDALTNTDGYITHLKTRPKEGWLPDSEITVCLCSAELYTIRDLAAAYIAAPPDECAHGADSDPFGPAETAALLVRTIDDIAEQIEVERGYRGEVALRALRRGANRRRGAATRD